MTFVRMRNDLRPLCPVHHSQMVSASFWLKVDTDVFPKLCYSCTETDCLYCYDVIQGYFTTREGEHIQRDMKYWQKCPKDGLPMYMNGFEPQGSARQWRCGQIGCEGSSVTQEPLQAAT
jgi:hypothetical protein